MKAVYIDEFTPSGPLKVKVGDLAKPTPADGELCIAVSYAGVNPVDAKIARGYLQTRMPHRFPLILGWEAAGVVHSIGQGKPSPFKVGDSVYAYTRKEVVQWGTWAEYVTCPFEYVARTPNSLTLAQAAAVPLAGLTAWQALFDKIGLQPGHTILIHAGAGGTGGYAIQWAKVHNCRVITTASPAKFSYVKKLGADEIINYQGENFVEAIKKTHPSGIDAVFDTLGKTVYEQSFEVLKPGGCIVSLLEQPNAELAKRFNVRADYLFVHGDGKRLQEITQLFDEHRILPPDIREYPLDQASLALEEIEKGHTLGKLVLKVTQS